ncbi:TetR/AcrR family transcriptional regulator [Staphylococcus cohnii]|uniref:TetR/AcrR family transcriptional regulator n=2 Tax=Staphylococcus cohnii TaxID=29382 RepID=UPI003AD7792B
MAEDRRVRKTQNAIKHAFIQLLNEKDLDKITISDIAHKADINRGTFYLHYEDKYMLLNKMENDYIEELSKTLNTKDKFYVGMDAEAFARIFTEEKLKRIILHINTNFEFYKTIFMLERRSQLETKISQVMYENMKKHLVTKDTVDGIPLDYFHSYVAGASISFIKYWVKDNRKIDPQTLVDSLFKIVFYGPLRLIAKEQYNISEQ